MYLNCLRMYNRSTHGGGDGYEQLDMNACVSTVFTCMHVCACVCVYVCLCMCVHTYSCTCIYEYVCMHACMSA